MKPRMSFLAYLKPRWKRSCALSAAPRRREGLSQVDMAFDILKKARSPLHISEILERIQSQFGAAVDRESLVSSLTRKVARGDRFLRPEKNTFALRPEAR